MEIAIVCVCVCVCVRGEGAREREKERESLVGHTVVLLPIMPCANPT